MLSTIKTWGLAAAVVSFVMVSASDSVTATGNPCTSDVKRLCGDVKPGQGRINACLKEHKDEISPECRTWVMEKAEEVRSKLEEVQKACSGDVERFCKGVQPGKGRINACLRQHKDELSQECKAAVSKTAEEVRKKLEKALEGCSGDAEKFCKGIAPGEGRILKCLIQHKDELSQECKNAMGKN